MQARVVRERDMADESEDDSDDIFTHERRDHHRRRSEPDVLIDNDDDDGVKQSKHNVTKNHVMQTLVSWHLTLSLIKMKMIMMTS